MRVIGRSELVIDDPFSGTELKIYYRIPSTSMRLAIAALLTDNELKPLEKYVEVGRSVVCGYPSGQFGVDDAAGETVVVDSDPASPHYDDGWMHKIFGDGSPNEDLLALLGRWVIDCLSADRIAKKK